MSQIYVVKYDYYGYNDNGNSSIFFNLKAFKDEDKAGKFLIECVAESVKQYERYVAYHDETKDEIDELVTTVKEATIKKTFDSKMPENVRYLAIRKRLEDLSFGHKYHFHYPAFAKNNDELEYTIETLELDE